MICPHCNIEIESEKIYFIHVENCKQNMKDNGLDKCKQDEKKDDTNLGTDGTVANEQPKVDERKIIIKLKINEVSVGVR